MEDKTLATVEYGAGITTITIFLGMTMRWLNENHLAIISICAIGTLISTIVFGFLRYRLHKKKVDFETKPKK